MNGPLTLVLASGAAGLAVVKVLSTFGLRVDRRPGGGALGTADERPAAVSAREAEQYGLILIATGSGSAAEACARLRSGGVQNSVLVIGRLEETDRQALQVDRWDGTLGSIIKTCLNPTPVSPVKLATGYRPYLEGRLRHDLPKIVSELPSVDAELVPFVMESIGERARIAEMVTAYLKPFEDVESRSRALRGLFERK